MQTGGPVDLVAISVVSAHIEETHRRWKLEAILQPGQRTLVVEDERFPLDTRAIPSELHWHKGDYRLLGADPQDFGPAFDDTAQFGGFMFMLDLQTGARPWRSGWDNLIATPSGFCFDGDRLFCADLEGSNIFEIDMPSGNLVRRISHPALNDVHYVVRTRRGLLVASTGTDMVVELDLDGNTLFEWWAGDWGFTSTPSGIDRRPDRHREHRTEYYHTRYQATHLNAARYRDPDERCLLVHLWHQGLLVEIDTALPPHRRAPHVVLDGLKHAHSLRPMPDGGWAIANSQAAEIVVLAPDLQVERRIPSVEGWIQDVLPLGDDLWLIADVNRFRLLVQDGQGKEVREYPFDRNWRVYGLEAVPRGVAGRLPGGGRR